MDPRGSPESRRVRAEPPAAPARPTRLRTPDDERDRPVVLAARPRRSRRARLPRSRERVHRGVARRTCASLRARLVRRDRRPRAGDRHQRAGPARPTTSTSPAPSRDCSTACTAGVPRRAPRCPTRCAAPGATPARSSCSTRTRSPTGHDYFAVGDLAVNPDQRLAAYSTDTSGGERYELRFRTVPTEDGADDLRPTS